MKLPPDAAGQIRERSLPSPFLAMGIALFALLLRLFQAARVDVHGDEVISLWIASEPARLLSRLAAEAYDHPPLRFLLLSPAAAQLEAGLIWGRLLSILFGSLSVLALFALGQRLFGRPAPTLAALFLALSPIQVEYGGWGTLYPLLVLTTILSVDRLLAALNTGTKRDWLLYATASLLCIASHYVGFLVLAAQAGYVGFTVLRRPKDGVRMAADLPHRLPSFVTRWLRVQFALGVVAALWFAWLFAHLDLGKVQAFEQGANADTTGRLAYRAPLESGFNFLYTWVAGDAQPTPQALPIIFLASVVAGAGAALGLWRAWRQGGLGMLVVAWATIPTFLLMAVSPLLPRVAQPRFFINTLPALDLLLGVGLASLLSSRSGRWAVVVVFLARALVLVTFLGLNPAPLRRASSEVASNTVAGDLVLYQAYAHVMTGAVYLPGRLRYWTGDGDGVVMPAEPGADQLEPISAVAAAHDTLWVVAYQPVARADVLGNTLASLGLRARIRPRRAVPGAWLPQALQALGYDSEKPSYYGSFDEVSLTRWRRRR